MKRSKRRLAFTVGVGALGVVGGLAVGSLTITMLQGSSQAAVANETSDKARQSLVVSNPSEGLQSAPEFKTNEHGQTYGSALAYDGTAESLPNLISVYMDGGGVGYVQAEEMFPEAFGQRPASPEEALALQQAARDQVLTAYDSNGKTAIGTYTIVVVVGYGG